MVTPVDELLDGWTFGQEPPSSYLNWWMYWVSQWIAYFADGNISLGNVHITGTLQVDGVSTFGADLDVAGHKVKHTNREQTIYFARNKVIDASGSVSSTPGQGGVSQAMTVDAYYELPARPPGGDALRLKSVIVNGNIAGAGNTATLYSVDATGTYTAVPGASGIVMAANGVTLTPSSPAVHVGEQYALRVASNSGICVLWTADLNWDVV